ncbi:MAG: double zinc ribbon domain-containing protein [Dehalococcoidia bacterium]
MSTSQPPSQLTSPGWRRLWDAALDFVFPPRCVVCGRDAAHLCADCAAEFEPAAGSRCLRCWTPGSAELCARCEATPPAFRSLRAAFVFHGATRDAILAVKYKGFTAAVAPLVDLVDASAFAPSLDLVTAVPMAGRRQRRRGHNQAELIARQIARRLQIPSDARALRRIRSTPQQAKQHDVGARRENVKGAFAAGPARVAGRSVLVVDDVTTSGATLNACALALLDAGAAAVDAWALARED